MPLFPNLAKREPLKPHQRLIRLAVVGVVGSQIVMTVFLTKLARDIVKE